MRGGCFPQTIITMDKNSKILDKAQKYIQKGYLDRAIDEYRKVLNAKPGDVSTRLRVGDLFVKIGKKEDAIEEYHEVARTLTKKGFYLKAIAVYKQILKLDPPNIDIRYRLAELYTRQNLIANAIGEYDILARHFESKGKREDTLNIIKKMLEIDSENVGIRLKLAEIYEQSGFHEDAVSEYGNAAERLIENGKYDTAEKLLHSLYDKGEKQPKVLEGLRAVAKEKGENEQCLSYSRELIPLYDELGEEEKKREMCEELLELFPDDSEILAAMEGPRGEDEAGDISENEEVGEEAGEVEEGIEGALEETEGPLEEQEVSEEPLIPWSEMVEIEDEPVLSEEPLNEAAEEEVEPPEPVCEETVFEEVTVEEAIGERAEVDAEPAGETFEELEQPDAEELTGELPGEPEPVKEVDEGFLEDVAEEVVEELCEAEIESVTDEDEVVYEGAEDDVEPAGEMVEALEQSKAEEPVEELLEDLEPVEEIGEGSLEEGEPEPINEEVELEEVAAEEEVICERAETFEELEQPDAEELVEELPGEPENIDEIEEVPLEEVVEETEEDAGPEQVSEDGEFEPVTAEEESMGDGADAGAELAAETAEELEHPGAEEFVGELPDDLMLAEEFEEGSLEEVVEETEEDAGPEQVSEDGEIEPVTDEEGGIGKGADANAEPAGETFEELEQPDAEELVGELPGEPEPVEEIDEGSLEGATEEVEDGFEGLGDDGEAPAESGYVDLSSELGLGGIDGSETAVDEFHDGLERQLNREDTETHYNMGIAYMEMDMYDEAVKDFSIALKDPNRVFDCQVRLGLIYMAKGEPQKAIACYTGGLDVTGRTSDERKGLMYELALAYETAGQDDSALDSFSKVSSIDSGFRDVAGKLRCLNEKSRFLSIDDNLIEVELL